MQHALGILLFFVVLSLFSIYYTVTNIGINTNTDDMLSKDLPYRQVRNDYFKSFPYHNDMILVVMSATNSIDLQQASRDLVDKLRPHNRFFKTVYLPGADQYFARHRFLYLDDITYSNFEQDLKSSNDFFTRLSKQSDTGNLIANIALSNKAKNNIINNVRNETISILKARQENVIQSLNWNSVLSSNQNLTGKYVNQLILIEPTDKYRDVLLAADALSLIRKSAQQLKHEQQLDFELRITGSLAMSYEELNSVSQGMGTAGIMALLFVVLLLWFGSRSFKILLFSLITLLVGLSLTAGFATLSVGSLNLISVAFAVLYIGLGIDFSIHLCLRYQELILQHKSSHQAIRSTAHEVGSSLVICAISTAIGFYAFIPTNFVGLSELGIISGTGMFISLIVSLSVLPALFRLSPLTIAKSNNTKRQISEPVWRFLSSKLQNHQRLIITVVSLMTIGSLFILTNSYFDYDLLNMRDSNSESVATFRELVKDKDNSPLHISVLVNDQQQLKKIQQELMALSTVKKVSSIYDFIPEDQQSRITKLKTLQQSLSVFNNELSQRSNDKNISSTITGLQKSLNLVDKTTDPELYNVVTKFISKISKLNDKQQSLVLKQLDESLMGEYSNAMLFLQQTLNPDRIQLQNLPVDDRRHWVSTISGRYLLLVYPRHSISGVEQLREFVNQVSVIVPNVTDAPAITLAAGDVAVSAFKQALLTALILITILLLVIYRNITDTLLVLTPLLLAALFTTALAVLLEIPFNFSNIIAIPLLFGIGVDNGIHMISRNRSTTSNDSHILHTSTSRAVVLSALTTVASFGNLGYSSHPGTASMGQLLTIGVLLTLISTLVILPVLMASLKRN
jgi:hopanoid biosynthesis associated RND transporter like protein HpnN